MKIYRGVPVDSTGMTLVEVMIALGIASVLALGVVSTVSISNRSVRNVSVLSDWNNLQASVRGLLSDSTKCSDSLKGLTLSFPGAGPYVLLDFRSPMRNLDLKNNAGTTVATLINPNPGQTAGGYVVTTMRLEPLGGSAVAPVVTTSISRNGSTYRQYPVQLALVANKPTAASGQSLGSTSVAMTIPFTVVVGPNAANTVDTCFTDLDASARACQDLGGNFLSTATPQCVLPWVHFGASSSIAGKNFAVSAPGGGAGVDVTGERIQLSGTPGTRAPNDYAIGMNTRTMWFNIGGDATSRFLWHSRYDVAGTDNDLMSLSAGANLRLNPSNAFVSSLLSFGNSATAPALFSVSTPAAGAVDAYVNNEGLDLMADGVKRAQVLKDGTFYLRGNTSGQSEVRFGDTAGTEVAQYRTNEWIASNRQAGAAMNAAANKWGLDFYTGGSVRLQIWNNGDVHVQNHLVIGGNTLMAGSLLMAGNAAIQGHLTVSGVGGNVYHGCQWYEETWDVQITGQTDHMLHVGCPVGTEPIAGGGSCGEANFARGYVPTSRGDRRDSANGWSYYCTWPAGDGLPYDLGAGPLGMQRAEVLCCQK